MISGSHHDNLTNSRTTRKENVIEGQRQQVGGNIGAPFHDSDQLLFKDFRHHLFYQLRSKRSHFRRFQNSSVARCKAGNQWPDTEVERKIPGCNNEANSLGFVSDLRPGSQVGQRSVNFSWFCPVVKMAKRVTDFCKHRVYLGRINFQEWLPEVLVNGFFDTVPVIKNPIFEFYEPFLPFTKRLLPEQEAPCLLLFENVFTAHVIHFFSH